MNILDNLNKFPYQNCLTGVLLLRLYIPESGEIIRRGTHFYYRTSEGIYYHFKLVKDIFPFPFCFLLFKGKFIKEREWITNGKGKLINLS